MSKTLTLPALGENIQSVTVVKVRVAAGDQVKPEQTLLEIETDKAVVEVPAPEGGRITQIRVHEGESLTVGQPFAEIDPEPTEAGQTEGEEPSTSASGNAATPPPAPSDDGDESHAPSADHEDKASAPAPAKEPSTADDATPTSPTEEPSDASPAPSPAWHVPAAPSVRRFAREVGIDVDTVKGSGAHGRVSIDDVKRHLRDRLSGACGAQAMAVPTLPDFSRWGKIRRETMRSVRLATARHVSASWQAVPRVTHFDEADIAKLEPLRLRYAERATAQGGKLTMAVMVVKVVASALRKFPAFNASIDMAAHEVVYKDYVHIGIAVATERGLLVPVIRNADRKNMVELAVEIDQIARKCREGKIKPEELHGGTFTVTNLGAIGGSFFTPIINYPEVAILGMGRAKPQPRVNADGAIEAGLPLPLSLSYDHRLIDGADAARFLRWIADALSEPLILALEAPA